MTTKSRTDSASRLATWLAAITCLLLIAHFSWRFVTTAANIAFADDIVDALWFFEIFRQTPDWLGRLIAMFLPNHEHILLFDHVIYLLYYAVAGELNFLHFVLIGNLSLPWLAYLLWRWAREHIDSRVALVVAVAFAFQLFSSESNFYAIASLSTKYVFIFAMMAFLCWQRNPAGIWLPLGWALLATAVQFNGLLVLIVLVLLSAVYGVADGRWRVRQLVCWSVIGLAMILAYIAYESPLTLDHLTRHVQATDSDKAHEFTRYVESWDAMTVASNAHLGAWDYLWRFIASLLVLVGASFWPTDMPLALYAAQLTGVIVLAALAWSAQAGWWRKPFWTALVIWVMASLLMLAIGRGLGLGEASRMVSRYRYYSFLLFFLALVPVWQLWVARWQPRLTLQLLLAAVAAGGISVAGLSEWRAVGEMIGKVQTSYRYLLIDGGLGRSQMPFYPHNLDRRLLKAHAGDYFSIYRALPARFKPQTMAAAASACPDGSNAASAVSGYSKSVRALAVELTFAFKPSAVGDEILLCNEAGGLVLTLGKTQRQTDSARYLPQVVLKSELVPAHYSVYARAIGQGEWRAIGAIEFR